MLYPYSVLSRIPLSSWLFFGTGNEGCKSVEELSRPESIQYFFSACWWVIEVLFSFPHPSQAFLFSFCWWMIKPCSFLNHH